MDAIRNNLLKVIDGIEKANPDALVFGLQPIFDESQRLVPVDRGRLKASGFIEKRQGVREASAAIGYDRHGKLGYGAFVHERLDLRHAPPTQAKFLETAVNTHGGDFQRRYVLFIQRETGLVS